MSDKSSTSAAEGAAGASSAAPNPNASNAGASATGSKGPASQGNPAFRKMGLPRLRLPSRNWLIFLSLTGSFASAVIYDKYQTRRTREKWCGLVSHISKEHLPTNSMPRKMTIYLAAPPGDGLRSAREHFHLYVKPILVAAAMDWDVVEGRKEGDVRHKTAERIRKKRKRAGEGEPLTEEEREAMATSVEALREAKGTVEYDGVAGDLVIGRNTWKEYVRGLHEGWLGPADPPKQPQPEQTEESPGSEHKPGQSSLGDAAVKAAVDSVAPQSMKSEFVSDDQPKNDASSTADDASPQSAESGKEDEQEKKEEKPKPRQPPPYIQPSEYPSAPASSQMPEMIGPSAGIRFPHILGFRNTPIRIYRFLTRRNTAESIGKEVAAAVLASYRPYFSETSGNDASLSSESEVAKVLEHEERDWWKTTYNERKEHEESVWIEAMTLDERIVSRMRAFQLTSEDEDRAKRIREGREKVSKDGDELS